MKKEKLLLPRDNIKPKVLIIDDNAICLQTLGQLFEDGEWRVVLLQESKKIWTVLDGSEPNIIIVDLNMPELDGLTLARQLKAHPDYKRIPLILTTSQDNFDIRDKAMKTGIDDFIPKPVNKTVLMRAMHRLLQLHNTVI